MEKKNVKEFLSQMFYINDAIKTKQEQLARLRDMQSSVRTSIYGEKTQSKSAYDRIADITAKIVDLENDCIMSISWFLDLKRKALEIIDLAEDPVQRTLLENRYINLKTWETIADDMHYSWDSVHRIHRKALSSLEAGD
ncbi:MAG: hypothetical protein LBL35_02345 [Clostridiales bacterium]|jgi:hypothetical protein|nr:hypothetical protein [Clostridiales bacterium]